MYFISHATATTAIYTLSLHDALPISWGPPPHARSGPARRCASRRAGCARSEEHTSELQSRFDLVCRLLLEKKKPSRPRSSRTWFDRGSATRSPYPLCLLADLCAASTR